MIYIKISNILKNFLFFIAHCRIFISADPDTVDAPAIIFSPLLPDQLNCGFAGLMTCRLREKPLSITADITIATLWNKLKKADLQSINARKNKAVNYLKGIEFIRTLEMAVAQLKEEEMQTYLFFQKDMAADLSHIAKEMKIFLTDEEKRLEDQAAFINSTDLETINSRLLLLKDIQWILEKDILVNLQKVLMLTGANKPSAVKPAAFRKYRKLNLLLNALDRLEVRGRDWRASN